MKNLREKYFLSFLGFNSLSGSASLSLIVCLQLLTFWAVWRWMAIRVWTSGEEVWGIVSIFAVIFFAFFWQKNLAKINSSAFIYPTIFTLFYLAGFAFAPPLVRAILAMTALTFTLSSWRFGQTFHLGIYVLLLLSLPVMASMNFFLGFPLRVVIGEAVEFLLKLQGLDVWREGVCLHFGEKLVWIDAPCSGVKMLWFGMFLTAVLVCFYQLKNFKSLIAFVLSFISILLGNIFRASALFYTETEIIKAPVWMHEAVGVFAFAVTALGIVFIIKWLNYLENQSFAPESKIIKITAPVSYARFSAFFLILACVAAFVVRETPTISQTNSFQGFPTQFEGITLKQLDLTDREKYFLEEFPGRIGRFSDGRREIIIRWVTEATRKLHSSEDCFNAFGYKTKPLPIKIDDAGNHWSCFSAQKNDSAHLRVCQRIHDNNVNEWTDVSAWYWSALRQNNGEWWAYTVAERDR